MSSSYKHVQNVKDKYSTIPLAHQEVIFKISSMVFRLFETVLTKIKAEAPPS